jgi:hypothetical protein
VSRHRQFSNRCAIIAQEAYVGNRPNAGLGPQMKAFHLQTEPWLFAIDKQGVIVARLAGAFGVTELRHALQAALR